MGALTEELERVQNPALAGVLLWRFSVGYANGSRSAQPTPLPLLFAVLPLVLYTDTSEVVLKTYESSGLRAFAAKLSDAEHSMADVAMSVHDRALRARSLTLTALRLALAKRLITIQPEAAAVHSLIGTEPGSIPTSTKRLMRAAYRLGVWCGSLSLYEVSTILKVSF